MKVTPGSGHLSCHPAGVSHFTEFCEKWPVTVREMLMLMQMNLLHSAMIKEVK